MKKFRIALLVLLFVGLAAALVLFLFTRDIPVLEPKGMIAAKERELIITAALLMLIVVIPVFIFTLYFGWKYRAENDAKHTPDWEHNSIAECCWWGVPLLIIVILSVITYKTSHDLNPFRPIHNGKKPVEIQAVALDWKWLFIYPEEGIATVNYVQFPEKTPINFSITADAPMNSFWIPQLSGQIYAMPAMRTELHLIADEVGTYRGCSSNISGKGFAGMTFQAVATSDQEFQGWVASVKGSGKVLGQAEYEKLVQPSEYDPVSVYQLGDQKLFDRIIMKYMAPEHKGGN